MWHFIEDSKYKNETISIVQSFADVMLPGDSITGIPSITVTVGSGIDPTPSTILYEGVSVTNGNTVEQRFRLGIIGVIYCIAFTITTTMGDTLEKDCYLAILPEDGLAIPTFTPAYETTTLYPYIQTESFIANAPTIGTGKLFGVVQVEDGITTSITIDTSVLTYQQYYYIYPLDAFTTDIFIDNGTLIPQTYIPYNDGPESIKTDIAILNGTIITATLITYNIPSDNIIASISVQNGTLV